MHATTRRSVQACCHNARPQRTHHYHLAMHATTRFTKNTHNRATKTTTTTTTGISVVAPRHVGLQLHLVKAAGDDDRLHVAAFVQQNDDDNDSAIGVDGRIDDEGVVTVTVADVTPGFANEYDDGVLVVDAAARSLRNGVPGTPSTTGIRGEEENDDDEIILVSSDSGGGVSLPIDVSAAARRSDASLFTVLVSFLSLAFGARSVAASSTSHTTIVAVTIACIVAAVSVVDAQQQQQQQKLPLSPPPPPSSVWSLSPRVVCAPRVVRVIITLPRVRSVASSVFHRPAFAAPPTPVTLVHASHGVVTCAGSTEDDKHSGTGSGNDVTNSSSSSSTVSAVALSSLTSASALSLLSDWCTSALLPSSSLSATVAASEAEEEVTPPSTPSDATSPSAAAPAASSPCSFIAATTRGGDSSCVGFTCAFAHTCCDGACVDAELIATGRWAYTSSSVVRDNVDATHVAAANAGDAVVPFAAAGAWKFEHAQLRALRVHASSLLPLSMAVPVDSDLVDAVAPIVATTTSSPPPPLLAPVSLRSTWLEKCARAERFIFFGDSISWRAHLSMQNAFARFRYQEADDNVVDADARAAQLHCRIAAHCPLLGAHHSSNHAGHDDADAAALAGNPWTQTPGDAVYAAGAPEGYDTRVRLAQCASAYASTCRDDNDSDGGASPTVLVMNSGLWDIMARQRMHRNGVASDDDDDDDGSAWGGDAGDRRYAKDLRWLFAYLLATFPRTRRFVWYTSTVSEPRLPREPGTAVTAEEAAADAAFELAVRLGNDALRRLRGIQRAAVADAAADDGSGVEWQVLDLGELYDGFKLSHPFPRDVGGATGLSPNDPWSWSVDDPRGYGIDFAAASRFTFDSTHPTPDMMRVFTRLLLNAVCLEYDDDFGVAIEVAARK
jgi:hypothetical protein